MAFGMQDATWSAIVEGVARGEYDLLLGAGASIGAQGGDGKPIPGAQELARELLADFGTQFDGENISLQQAYELVQGRRDPKGAVVSQYLRNRFSNCSPSWHQYLPQLRWHRIWTLNIDDVVEHAYQRSSTKVAGSRPVRTLEWASPFRELDLRTDELQIVHLHGFAPYLTEDSSKLVFSIVEYLQATAARYTWHRVFGDAFLQRPFIVIGARLTDEYDLAECLRRGSASETLTGRPSLVVLRTISPIQREQFNQWHLHTIEAEAVAFLDELATQVKEVERRLGDTLPGFAQEVPQREARVFLQQFQSLNLDAQIATNVSRDLYGGDDPAWEDALQNRIAIFELADKLATRGLEQLNSQSVAPLQAVHCIWGPAGSGKSCVLLSIAAQLARSGVGVFRFRAEERLDIESILWWLQRSPRSAIMIDGVADFAFDVAELAQEAHKRGTGLLLYTTERESRLRAVLASIQPQFLLADDEHQLGRLSDHDIQSLLNKLTDHRRLGRLTRLPNQERVQYFQRFARRDLLAGMAELEGARGFRERIIDEFRTIEQNRELQSVYAICSMSYALGYHCPLGVVSVATGVDTRELFGELRQGGRLAGILRAESAGLRPRHRRIASTVVEGVLTPERRFILSQALIKALAPLVTPQTITLRTRPYRIARELMDQEVVWTWMGRRRSQAWYEDLVPLYDWNARFWEQRALLEARLGADHLPKARSFAEEALRIHRDPFTLNTLGTILLRMAVQYHTPDSAEARHFLWLGIEHLTESRDLGNSQFEYPFMSFFTYVQRYARAAMNTGTLDRRLSGAWNDWFKTAEASPAYAHPTLYENLQGFKKAWLSLAIREQ